MIFVQDDWIHVIDLKAAKVYGFYLASVGWIY